MNPQQHQTRPILFVAIVLAAAASGCGARLEPVSPVPAECPVLGDQLSGRWEGTWQSLEGRGTRAFQAEFVACGNSEYRARYQTHIGSLLPLSHEMTHSASRRADTTQFRGELGQNGLLGRGTRFEGSTDGVTLVIHYQSARDFGVIRLRRADPDSAPGLAQVLAGAMRNRAG